MAITEVSSEVVDEVEDQEDQIDADQDTPEEDSDETSEDQGDESESGADDDNLVISIEGEEEDKTAVEAAAAPQWVKDLRKENREHVRKLREYEAKEAAREAQTSQQKQQELGEKPTLAGCDYDEEVYEPKLADWYKRKSEAEARERDARTQQERAAAEWKGKVEAHQKAAAALKVPDYEEAEDVVKSLFSDVQQGILVEVADNSALLAYAIGKRPAKAKELAAITNPIKLAAALARLEDKVKTQPKKTAPPPEIRVRGSAPVSGVVDSKLAKLEADADRTGDRSKVVAYKREMKRA